MGTYVYRVTAKRVICSDGKPANIAKYAYKPFWSWDGEKANARMDFRSGCPASRRLASEGRLTDRIVFEDSDGKVFGNPNNYGTFHDADVIGTQRMPRLEGITGPSLTNS
jgi:hypothetical protein